VNSISETRLGEVHPQLAARVRKMADRLLQEGIEIQVTQSLRSWSEQQGLYNQGRDADGNIVDKSKVVTHAKPGYSYHNMGLAVDVAPFDAAIPDWNANHPIWKRIVAVGESVGLISGSEWRTFPDWPHFQYTGNFPASPDDAVRAAYQTGGLEAIWNLVVRSEG
jgi:peptidoglycan L-alanyl-D-glutamate endopeptidase CwlK